ncbi:sentrin-specific protease 3 isoform X1 [Rhizophagus clarus]|uniref:Sentrin-specific protease 3 isoform X1 n=1 Tax=Rhizophagus clarus TaxID=94130 RepID=A0A8H3QB56_9GLOM|nr:sentrin-specific protease 3 isoform X1 [Rhizophagus clarus]
MPKCRKRIIGLDKYPEVSKIFDHNENSQMELSKWLCRNSKDVIYINSESLTAEKLYELWNKNTWLSSDHINAYLSYLNTKFHHIFSLSSFFYTKLTMTGYSSVVRWTKRTQISQKKIIFVPINLHQSHWILAAIFMKDPYRIVVFDSLGSITNDYAIAIGKNLVKWLNEEYRKNYNSNEIGDQIKVFLDIMFLNEKPPQVDGHSCGVFVCLFARLMAENIERDKIKCIAKFEGAIEKFRKPPAVFIKEFLIFKINLSVIFDDES